MKQLVAAAAALALAAAPAAASAARAPQPASESVEGSELRGAAYWLLPALVIIALLVAISAGGDEEPESP